MAPRELQVKDVSDSPNGSRNKKNRWREDDDSVDEGRSNKLSAVYADEVELLELFDKESEKLQLNGKSRRSKGKKTYKK
ncbi:hypothetical protein EV1_012938 [Malus domestica]